MRAARSILTILLLAAPLPSLATPLTFVLAQGTTTARLSVNGVVIGSASGKLSSGFVEFDPSNGALSNFDLIASSVVVTSPFLPAGYDEIDLSVELKPAAGFSASATGSNPWSIVLGPLTDTFVGSVVDTAPGGLPPIPISGVIPVNNLAVTAAFNDDKMRLGVFGVKVGELHWNGVDFVLRADIEFVGFAVPEPGVVALALAGLASLSLLRRPTAV